MRQATLHRPEGREEQRRHHQAADQCQLLAAPGVARHHAVGVCQLSALVLLDGIEQAAQSSHQLVAPARWARSMAASSPAVRRSWMLLAATRTRSAMVTTSVSNQERLG